MSRSGHDARISRTASSTKSRTPSRRRSSLKPPPRRTWVKSRRSWIIRVARLAAACIVVRPLSRTGPRSRWRRSVPAATEIAAIGFRRSWLTIPNELLLELARRVEPVVEPLRGHERAEAREQLAAVVGLREVVVGARRQALDDVALLAARRQHEHRKLE